MKFTSIFVGALATIAAAAPAPKEAEKRSFLSGGFNQFSTGLQFGSGFDVLGAGNNFAFNNLNVAYLAAFNGFQNNIFSNLIVNQGLAFDPFADLFAFGAGQNFLQLDHILGLQSALVFSWLGNAGLINGVNFSGGAVPFLDFGNLGGFISPFSQFSLGIDQVITTQITSFVDGTGLFAGQLGGGFNGLGGVNGFGGGIGFKE